MKCYTAISTYQSSSLAITYWYCFSCKKKRVTSTPLVKERKEGAELLSGSDTLTTISGIQSLGEEDTSKMFPLQLA